MIRKAFLALCAIGFLATPLTANSQNPPFGTGNDLLVTCDQRNRNDLKSGMCLGFIIGASDGFTFGGILSTPGSIESYEQHCVPSGVNIGQTVDVVVTYLRQNPAVRHRNAVSLVVESLRNAFPCRSRRSR